MYSILKSFVYIMVICTIISYTSAHDKKRWCAACQLVVDEIEYEISKIDPQKVLEVEGFRVDPSGNQKNKKIPYSRSETHLTEITESLCNRMNEFLESKNENGDIKYVLSKSRDGKPVQLENVSMSGDIAEKLRHMCNSIIEEHEDSIVEFFRKPVDDSKTEFCSLVTDYCADDADSDEENEEL